MNAVTPEFTPEVLADWPIPIWVWAVLWLLAGVHLSIAAFQPKHAFALAAIQSMSLLWAIVFIISAFNRATVYGILAAAEPIITASVFVCLVGIIYSLSKTVNLTNVEFEKRVP